MININSRNGIDFLFMNFIMKKIIDTKTFDKICDIYEEIENYDNNRWKYDGFVLWSNTNHKKCGKIFTTDSCVLYMNIKDRKMIDLRGQSFYNAT